MDPALPSCSWDPQLLTIRGWVNGRQVICADVLRSQDLKCWDCVQMPMKPVYINCQDFLFEVFWVGETVKHYRSKYGSFPPVGPFQGRRCLDKLVRIPGALLDSCATSIAGFCGILRVVLYLDIQVEW